MTAGDFVMIRRVRRIDLRRASGCHSLRDTSFRWTSRRSSASLPRCGCRPPGLNAVHVISQERGDLPMDRLNRTLAGCGLTLLLALPEAAGARSPRSRPAGPIPATAGRPPRSGSARDPHPMSGRGSPVACPGRPAARASPQLGTPGPAATANSGAPDGQRRTARPGTPRDWRRCLRAANHAGGRRPEHVDALAGLGTPSRSASMSPAPATDPPPASRRPIRASPRPTP